MNVVLLCVDMCDIFVLGVKFVSSDDVDEDEIDLFLGFVNVFDCVNDE